MRVTTTGIGELQVRLAQLQDRARSLRPAMEAGALDVKKLVDDSFYHSRDPETGAPWAALAASTIERKGSSKPLIDTGRLRGSIATNAENRLIRVGTNVHYAGPHHDGTKKFPRRRFIPETFTSGPAAATLAKVRRRIMNYLLTGKPT